MTDNEKQMKQNKQINKPITMVVSDFEQNIVNQINELNLPYFIIASSLEKILVGVKNAADQQLQSDTAMYNNQIKEMGAND